LADTGTTNMRGPHVRVSDVSEAPALRERYTLGTTNPRYWAAFQLIGETR
jgi:CHAT domain-containing protein